MCNCNKRGGAAVAAVRNVSASAAVSARRTAVASAPRAVPQVVGVPDTVGTAAAPAAIPTTFTRSTYLETIRARAAAAAAAAAT